MQPQILPFANLVCWMWIGWEKIWRISKILSLFQSMCCLSFIIHVKKIFVCGIRSILKHVCETRCATRFCLVLIHCYTASKRGAVVLASYYVSLIVWMLGNVEIFSSCPTNADVLQQLSDLLFLLQCFSWIKKCIFCVLMTHKHTSKMALKLVFSVQLNFC